MKKFGFIIVVVFFFFSLLFGQKIGKDAILGKWFTSEKECIVLIYKVNDKYYGKISWIKEPLDESGFPVKDLKNPNPNLRSKPLLGKTFMFDFEYTGDGEWQNGKVYNANNGKTYNAQLWMEEPDILILRGYIGTPLLGMNSTWTRVR